MMMRWAWAAMGWDRTQRIAPQSESESESEGKSAHANSWAAVDTSQLQLDSSGRKNSIY